MTTSPTEKEIEMPEPLTVTDAAFASDGGSIYLGVRDAAGAEHHLYLWQHLFKEGNDPKKPPGRLCLDGSLVPVRSDLERRLIAALRGARIECPAEKNAGGQDELTSSPGMIVGDDIKDYYSKIAEGPAAATAHLVKQLIDYVESEDYVELARELGAT